MGGHLVEAASPQVVRNDDIRYRVEHKLNVIRVRGARHVAINLLGRGLVLGFELCLNVGGRLPVLLSTCKQAVGNGEEIDWHGARISSG